MVILLSKLLHRQIVGSLHGKVLMVGLALSVPEHRLFASGQK
jgi:hypothetical protein